MWLGKWIVGSILLRENIFTPAIDALLNRTATHTHKGDISRLAVITRNFETMFCTPIKLLFLGSIVVCLLLLIFKSVKNKKNYFNNWYYLIIAFMPIVWYTFATQHSAQHFWFTYREISILIFAVLIWLVVNIEEATPTLKC